ncbi:MAG: hypothetical protein KAJ44_03800 [Thermoplasmatales archaeon]|nr:hypothetical protein [Thermoplasmatales archaeon]
MTIPKPRKIIKNWFFWLIVITVTAIILRSLPAWTNAAWGCDFGIYYGLTNSLVDNQELFNPYYGWGGSYQYFPVLYAVTGAAHWITGIDVLTIMPKIAPIFGGLSVLLFYFVVYELLGDRKKALLSSLFLAVMPFHVYQTSHASPLTIGHFFMMFSIYFFIKFRKDTRFIIPLFISTILLIMSHHLTTYFYLVSLICIVFVENASKKEWTHSLKKDVLYILATSGLIFSYWIFIATPVYDSFMRGGLRLGPININSSYTIILFYMLFASMFGIVWLKRRLNLFIIRGKPTVKSAIVKFFLTMAICLTVMSIFSVFKLPWTNFSFTPLSIIYSLPLILIFAFGVAGFRYTRFIQNGSFIRGWLLAILVSFVYGLLTNSSAILPHRHFEYIMAPLSIISIFGISGIFLNLNYERISKFTKKIHHINKPSLYYFKKSSFLQKRQLIYIAVIFFLVTANAVSVYPSHVALNASYEVITGEDFAVIEWMDENFDKNSSIIASDHRLARITEAVGFNTTLDESSIIWISENFTDYIHELEGIGKNYGKITHVIIDDIMKDRVVHVGFGEIFYMTNESYEKFSYQPFELAYRNATLNQDMEEEHWAEVYTVNWTFIKEILVKA